MQVEMLQETHLFSAMNPGNTFIYDGIVYLVIEDGYSHGYRAASLKTGLVRQFTPSDRVLPARYKAVPNIPD